MPIHINRIMAFALVLGATSAQAEIREDWENRRVMKALSDMAVAANESGPRRLALQERRKVARADAKVLRAEAKASAAKVEEACATEDPKVCFDATEASQEAHMAFTVNMGERLEIPMKLAEENILYGLKMADTLITAAQDVGKHRAKKGKVDDAKVDQLEAQANAFMDKAMRAVRSAAVYNAQVATKAGKSKFAKATARAQAMAARDTLKAIDRFGKKYGGKRPDGAPHERLEILQHKFVAFTAINREARGALKASVLALRQLNAAAAASVAAGMLGTVQGGVSKNGRDAVTKFTEDLDDLHTDMDFLAGTLGGDPDSAGESTFDDDDGFMD